MLREWQKMMIRGIYDPVDENLRRLIRTALISMAKKNGKTTLIAALVLVHLVGPEAIPQQEIYSAANDREQASLVYRAAQAMVELNDEIGQYVRPVPSRKRLICARYGSFYQALSTEVKTKAGISPSVFIYDELGEAPNGDLFDSLNNAQGAWDEPLAIIISVQARDPKSIMSDLIDTGRKVIADPSIDPTFYAAIWEVPPEADIFDEKNWPLANPALGDFLDLDDMRKAARFARQLPSRANAFRNLRLNQQVDGIEQVILREDWLACGGPVDRERLAGAECYGGLDLSGKRDLTALGLVFPGNPMAVLMECWTPEKGIADRARKDNAPYPKWVEDGFIHAVPGVAIDYPMVARRIGELHHEFNIRRIGFDPWGMDRLEAALNLEGIPYYRIKLFDDVESQRKAAEEAVDGAICFVEFGQGFKSMHPALEATEIQAASHNLLHGMNPVLTWAVSNGVAEFDAAGNHKLTKKKARNRIDPFVAMTMAIGTAIMAPPDPEPTTSIFDDLDQLRAAMKGE